MPIFIHLRSFDIWYTAPGTKYLSEIIWSLSGFFLYFFMSLLFGSVWKHVWLYAHALKIPQSAFPCMTFFMYFYVMYFDVSVLCWENVENVYFRWMRTMRHELWCKQNKNLTSLWEWHLENIFFLFPLIFLPRVSLITKGVTVWGTIRLIILSAIRSPSCRSTS